MKKFLLAALVATFLPAICYGQHSDIEFGFTDFNNPTEIEIEITQQTTEGILVAEGEFEELFGGDLEADDPGFITPADEGLRINVADEINVMFLDGAGANSSIAQGFVTFFNPATGALEPGTSSITISNQFGDSVVLDGETISGGNSIFLAEGSDGTEFRADGTPFNNAPDPDEATEILGAGEIHNHLTFNLDDATAQTGAFGILFQFDADFADANGDVDSITDLSSEPLWLIFNNGLSEGPDGDFETLALPAFGVVEAVPEPAAGIVLCAMAGGILSRRRRRT